MLVGISFQLGLFFFYYSLTCHTSILNIALHVYKKHNLCVWNLEPQIYTFQP